MQLIHVVFLFATANCINNVSHSHQFKPEVSAVQAKEDFFALTKWNLTETNLTQEATTIIYITTSQQSTESKNVVPINENEIPIEMERMHEAAESPIQSSMKWENATTADSEEKNEVPDEDHNGNQYDTKNDPTRDKESMENNCSIMWPECANLHNATEDVARELTGFSLNLFKTLSSHVGKSNIVISPISVAFGLSQLMLGSSGKTKEDMLNTLYGGIKDPACVHDAIQNLTSYESFVSANEIFFNKEFSLKEEFINQSSRFYRSKGIQLQREEKKGLRTINSWVSKATNGLITSVLKEIPPDFQLMLINVIQYQGKWINRFDPNFTKKEIFHTTSSGSIKVPMMNNHKYPLQSIRDTELQAHVARLPLSENCSLIIFLPLSQEKDALKNLEKRLEPQSVTSLMTELEKKSPRATAVSLPKLKLDSDIGLMETLGLLGLYDLFENPDLCALSNSTGLTVSDVRHRAILEIKEDGLKAAAATSVTVARSISLFSVQRPFLFILANDKNKIPIVIGHVTDPSK
ncbi:plasma protease C1 inhibitor-like [Rhinoderma darwinii]|uniref:plasma protease C1 inhibitor-like n=1 Tax=Rhinoderma darwinii TaxID=43563 RepID=UPI003F66A0F6